MAVAEAPSELLFDEAHNRRLAEMYAPCFTLVLQLRASHEFGDAEVLRDRIKAMFARAKEDALRARLSSEEAEAAKFPLVAFIDETILSSNWSQKDRWAARTLQLEL
ncbi:MAG: DotU family type IV/VI secretion system protein, partial [Rhodothermales bacterium]